MSPTTHSIRKQISSKLYAAYNSILLLLSTKAARFFLAVLVTLFLLLVTWLGDKTTHSFGGEGMIMKSIHLLSLLTDSTAPGNDKFLNINISYDQQFTPINDEYGMPMGEINVTDRDKLSRFLEMVNHQPYSSIAIDIFFDPALITPADSLLFDKINRMDRVAVVRSAGSMPDDRIDPSKVAISDYNINIYDNSMAKYSFLSSDMHESLALKTYTLATSDKIDFSSPLVQSVLYLFIRYPLNERYRIDGTPNWYNLGCDILDVYDEASISQLIEGKIIIIGDYNVADMHDTYVGQISGPAIVVNAIEALYHKDYRIKVISFLGFTFLYLALSLFMAYGISIEVLWRKFNPSVRLVLNFINYSIILTAFEILLGIAWHEFHEMMWPALILALYSSFCRDLNTRYPLKIIKKESEK